MHDRHFLDLAEVDRRLAHHMLGSKVHLVVIQIQVGQNRERTGPVL
jgi:hypothetical protein